MASKVVYSEVSVSLRAKHTKGGPLSVEDAKAILGWTTEGEGEEGFGKDYLFRDLEGNKVRLLNNLTNRPFRRSLAQRYASEMLRGKWALNGETVVVDRLGGVQSGQHRLVGFILAEQERRKNVEKWKEYGWRGPISLEMLVVTGISEKAEVTDTLDLGQKRSLGDVIFRNHDFGELADKEQKRLSNVLAGACRLVWLRVGGRLVSDAPHFPHSEALDFLEAHPRLKEVVDFIHVEEGGSGAEGKKISGFISLGYASALCYLMGVAKTDPVKFAEKGSEALNYKLMDKAQEFWTLFASGAGLDKGNPILALRSALMRIDASGGLGRDEICGTVIKAWNLWVDGKEGDGKAIKVKRGKDEDGRIVLLETPRIGGLDVEQDIPEEEEPDAPEADAEDTEEGEEAEAPKAEKKPKSKGKTKTKGKKSPEWSKRIGEWVWVEDAEGEHWKGQIKEVEGENAILSAEADGKDYAADVSQLRDDKPE